MILVKILPETIENTRKNRNNKKYRKIFKKGLIFDICFGVINRREGKTEISSKNIKEGKNMELQKVQRTTLTMKEAAEYLGISYWLVNQLVRRKQIPCSKVGGKYLFRVQALDEYLENMEQQSIS